MYLIILLLSCIITILTILLLKITKIETQALLFGIVFLTSYCFYFILLFVEPPNNTIPKLSHKIPIIYIDPKNITHNTPTQPHNINTPNTVANTISNTVANTISNTLENTISNTVVNTYNPPPTPKGNFCTNCFRELNSLNQSPFNQSPKNLCKYCSPNYSIIY